MKIFGMIIPEIIKQYKIMKKERKHIFKAEVTRDFLGKFHFTSYSNREIPPDLLNRMNCALQDLAEDINKDAPWKKRFIEFYYDGNKYRSVSKSDPHSSSCDGCVFWNPDMKKCYHPYCGKATKGSCEGIIYVKEKSFGFLTADICYKSINK